MLFGVCGGEFTRVAESMTEQLKNHRTVEQNLTVELERLGSAGMGFRVLGTGFRVQGIIFPK